MLLSKDQPNLKTIIRRLDAIISKYHHHVPKTKSETGALLLNYSQCYDFALSLLGKDEVSIFEPLEYYDMSENKITNFIYDNSLELKKLLFSYQESNESENKDLEIRVDELEEKINKFDERINYVMGVLDSYEKIRTDIKEIVDLHRKSKNTKPET